MKTLKKIKLNHYADEELKEREMNLLRGGGDDDDKYCVCKKNDSDNANANIAGGYTTAGGEGDCFSIINGTLGNSPHKNQWP